MPQGEKGTRGNPQVVPSLPKVQQVGGKKRLKIVQPYASTRQVV